MYSGISSTESFLVPSTHFTCTDPRYSLKQRIANRHACSTLTHNVSQYSDTFSFPPPCLPPPLHSTNEGMVHADLVAEDLDEPSLAHVRDPRGHMWEEDADTL